MVCARCVHSQGRKVSCIDTDGRYFKVLDPGDFIEGCDLDQRGQFAIQRGAVKSAQLILA